jgi:uncharacterized protein YecT (DUF1311 family)
MRLRLVVVTIFLCVASTLLWSIRTAADEKKHRIDAWLDKQLETASSETTMRRATGQARQMWDQEMSKSYSILMRRLDSEQKAALIKSQKSWLAYRDAEFDLVSKTVGRKSGLMWQTVAAGDRMEIVKARALMLEEYRTILNE